MAASLRDQPMVRELLQGANLPSGPEHVELVFTHGSIVLLAGGDVYKIKRAKDYGFFDYSTLERREHFCRLEVALNRRTAPDVYLGVLPVRRDAAGHSLTRPGEIVDWAVHMRRLPEAASAREWLRRGALGPSELDRIAARAARFYREAEAHEVALAWLKASIAENFVQLEQAQDSPIRAEVLAEVRARQQRWVTAHEGRLAKRSSRDGHGDLRLEHVYLERGEVLLLDCIEFLDRFRIADPALDAAFLAMDLRRHGREDLAEVLLARFAYHSDDYDLYPLIDGYVSYRALVRAKVACFVAADEATPEETAQRKRTEAAALAELAQEALAVRKAQPRLVGVGGAIASGKTTVARRIADVLAAPIVSADATRKSLAGLSHEERGGQALYTPAFDRRVHDEILRRAQAVLASGRSVLIDTTFRTRALRSRARELAGRHGAAFTLVECRAPEAETRARLQARAGRGGVSDAREDLLETFLQSYEPPAELPADQLIDLDTTAPESAQRARLATLLASAGSIQ